MEKKRINYTPDENKLLIHLVQVNKDIIENKSTNAVSNKEKDEAWKHITIQFNEKLTHVHRDESSLRKQWSNIKQDCRKKAAESRRQLYKTGGGPPAPEAKDIEETIILEVINTKTISGLDNENDCDPLSQSSTNTYMASDNDPEYNQNHNISGVEELVVEEPNVEDSSIQKRRANRQWVQKRRPVKRNCAVEEAKVKINTYDISYIDKGFYISHISSPCLDNRFG
ncbi:unnamed protein product [Diabrotica balteata]|uniref:Regulatory protein zeste n=1 Tax=Diabrotica balteata TaxID=107213 RepID=A0A9N9XGG9_DIABA|nr:unnamed protein product [Diabrotica balteata]